MKGIKSKLYHQLLPSASFYTGHRFRDIIVGFPCRRVSMKPWKSEKAFAELPFRAASKFMKVFAALTADLVLTGGHCWTAR